MEHILSYTMAYISTIFYAKYTHIFYTVMTMYHRTLCKPWQNHLLNHNVSPVFLTLSIPCNTIRLL